MKYLIHVIGIILIMLILSGCEDYLDREVVVGITGEKAFASYDAGQAAAVGVYKVLPQGFSRIGGAMMASASDEAEHTQQTSLIHKFNTGFWNENENPDDAWSKFYIGIRRANTFLANIDEVNLDQYKYDPAGQQVFQQRLQNIERWKYEVRFLRAFFYFELVKRYGGVPILTKPLDIESDFKNTKRHTLDECIQFIIEECDSAANMLPLVYPETDLGRATKGAALALKSRVLLYAASDLFNTPSWASGYTNLGLISLDGDRTAKWQAAADAAKAVIDLEGSVYSLEDDYENLFDEKSYRSPEIIFAQRNGESNSFEKASYPIGYNGGNSGTTPSQNLVDDYEMKDGTKFDWNNSEHVTNPFSNRDPRFYHTILTNGTLFQGRPVECWRGGLDGPPTTNATRTGYYLRKYVNPNLDLLKNTKSVHTWILIRLAEIYLNYAETLNECQPGHPDIRTYVNKVRERGAAPPFIKGMMPPLPGGLSQSEMRDKIRHERRIELAFEDHRLWDLRRWMLGTTVLNEPLKGLQITMNPDSTYNYEVIEVENRVFEQKMYLYPIPRNELNIMDDLQNPLW